MIYRLFWSAILVIGLSRSAHAGFIEICKDSVPVGALTGLFSFTVAGQSGTFPAPVGACTPAFQLPNGPAFITEVPKTGSTIFGVSTFPTNRLDSFDPITGTARVQIVAGDISTQTVVTFANTPAGPSIPEPGTGWLLGLGLAYWGIRRNLTKRPLNPRALLQLGSRL